MYSAKKIKMKFKKVEIQNHHQIDIQKVMITLDDVKYRIIPTKDGKGLRINKMSDYVDDSILIHPKATNLIEIK